MKKYAAAEMSALPIDELTAHHKAVQKERADLKAYQEQVGKALARRGKEVRARRMLQHMSPEEQQVLARAMLDFLGPTLGGVK